jgi:hypothetical protein
MTDRADYNRSGICRNNTARQKLQEKPAQNEFKDGGCGRAAEINYNLLMFLNKFFMFYVP